MLHQKLLSVFISIVTALFLLSSSFTCVLLLRQSYYLQIDMLNLPERTGYSKETIIDAYDDIVDYCIKGGGRNGLEFSAGGLSWTEDGKAHFDDAARLFQLAFTVSGATCLVLLIYAVLRIISIVTDNKNEKTDYAAYVIKKTRPFRFFGRGPLFYGSLGVIITAVFVFVSALIDFDAFFTGFHSIFFPGKSNWILTPETDEIINILPEEVFGNFALLILILLLSGSAVFIAADIIAGRKEKYGS